MLHIEKRSVLCGKANGTRVRALRGTKRWLVILMLATISVSTLAEGQGTWQVDARYSVARFFLGSGSDALEIGLARINGDVVFVSSVGANPRVHLSIKPDNGSRAEYAEMSFTSKQSAIADDGKIVFTGDIIVTRVERPVLMEPNEAYHGADFGEPVVSSVAREVTVVVSAPHLAEAQSTTLAFSGSTTISQEAFPQLLDVLEQAGWPTVLVNDLTCEAPSTIGEDFHGATCSGTVIASVDNRTLPTGAAGGEGYYGFTPLTSPDRSHATITLDVKLRRMPQVSSFTEGASGPVHCLRPTASEAHCLH